MAVKEVIYKDAIFKLSYELVNPSQEKAILVLHGWGSTKRL